MSLTLVLKQKPKKYKIFGLLMISAGLLIFGYLRLIHLTYSTTYDPTTPDGVFKETQGAQTVSFAQLQNSESESFADPGLKVSTDNLTSFGSILGLKTQNNPGRSNGQRVLPEFLLSIPRLKIQSAKVKTNVDGTSKEDYLKALKEAVAHFKGTALPGEMGNIFLFGHSMLPILARGQYESIFTNLPKLQKNDVVKIKYGEQEFTYLIEQTAIVDPTDVFVLQQSQTEEKITLMTCIPPGFGEKRFVAIGRRVN